MTVHHLTLDELAARAERLTVPGTRSILGITGPPGAGKSTIAEELVARLRGAAVLVPMDGFHLDDSVLDVLGRRDRKGAPDTFDAAGYVHMLRRLRAREDHVVYAPVFRREREEAIAGALAVPDDVPLVVTEGNYLLAGGPFGPVRDLLTETWFVDLDPGVRRARLVARHVAFGRSDDDAEAWVTRSDDHNAEIIEATRALADLVVRIAA